MGVRQKKKEKIEFPCLGGGRPSQNDGFEGGGEINLRNCGRIRIQCMHAYSVQVTSTVHQISR